MGSGMRQTEGETQKKESETRRAGNKTPTFCVVSDLSLPEQFCIRFVQFFLCGILLFLTVLSACVTCTVYGGAEIVEYGRDYPLLHAAAFALLMWLLRQKNRKKAGSPVSARAKRAAKKRYGRLTVIAAGALAVWTLLLMGWAGSDSRLCMESARCLLEGDMSPWAPIRFAYGSEGGAQGYAYTYPLQNGLILYMALFYALFRSAAPYVMQLFNILFLLLGMGCLAEFVKQSGERGQKRLSGQEQGLSGGARLTGSIPGMSRALFYEGPSQTACLPGQAGGLLLSLMLYLPFSFYVIFAYGTMPGFGLSCLALYRIGRYIREERGADLWIGAAAAAGAVLLKSNYQIVLTALVIDLAAESVFQKRRRLFGAALLVAAIYIAGSKGLGFCMERLTGAPVSGGIPMTAWAEMGLSEGKRGPGWYNGYNVRVFWENGGDTERTAEAVQSDLAETVSGLAADPGACADFFVRKAESIWAEPTFQSLWIQEVGGGLALLHDMKQSLFKKGGVLNTLYLLAANWLQTLIYAGALLWVLLEWKRIRWGNLIPGIIFIGGFLFHLVWEAKGQYTVCYAVLLIPYAWMGIQEAAQRKRLLRIGQDDRRYIFMRR